MNRCNRCGCAIDKTNPKRGTGCLICLIVIHENKLTELNEELIDLRKTYEVSP